jgi:hypothetical protein
MGTLSSNTRIGLGLVGAIGLCLVLTVGTVFLINAQPYHPAMPDVEHLDNLRYGGNFIAYPKDARASLSLIMGDPFNAASPDETPQISGAPALTATQEFTDYLPIVAQNWSAPTPVPTIVPPDSDIPCLLILGQEQISTLPLYAGCSPAGAVTIIRRYRGDGALIGFDYFVKDNQNNVLYDASIDIQRKANGQIKSYSGFVNSANSPEFTEAIVNSYDPSTGGLLGADVIKAYTNGPQYQMKITSYCPNTIGPLIGYRVKIFSSPFNGQEVTVGTCS